MFTADTSATTSGKMDARKEFRLHKTDEARIKAAAATGLPEADFIC